MDNTCVVLRVVKGTAVIALLSTKVPVEDVAVCLTRHWHTACCVDSPASNWASRTGISDTFTATDGIWEVLNPCAENFTP
jgi:hypothetical protein